MKNKLDNAPSQQKISLQILDEAISVLNTHGLNWFIAYGTLLGAIRHGGMIPWDDDIDLLLPRKDFNQLLTCGDTWFKRPFFLETPHNTSLYRHFIRLKLDGTTCLPANAYELPDAHYGLYIDIFPLDHVPDDELQRDNTLTTITLLETSIMPALWTCANARQLSASYTELLTQIDTKYKNSGTVMQTAYFQDTNIRTHKLLPATCFAEYDLKDFAGLNKKVRVPKNSEKVLEIIYGANWRVPVNYNNKLNNAFIDTSTDFRAYLALPKQEFKNLFINETLKKTNG